MSTISTVVLGISVLFCFVFFSVILTDYAGIYKNLSTARLTCTCSYIVVNQKFKKVKIKIEEEKF